MQTPGTGLLLTRDPRNYSTRASQRSNPSCCSWLISPTGSSLPSDQLNSCLKFSMRVLQNNHLCSYSISHSLQNHVFNQTQTYQGLNVPEKTGNNMFTSGGGPLSQPSPYTKPPPIDIQLRAADVYFQYCHNQPYSLFHEQTFREKLTACQVPFHLLFAFLASVVRYSTDAYYGDKIDAIATYTRCSWKAIVMPWNGIEDDAGISIVQTMLLLAIIDYTGDYAFPTRLEEC